MENNEKTPKDTTPQWFRTWRDNDFKHAVDKLEVKIVLNTKLSIAIITAILAFAVAIIVANVILP